VKDFEDFGDVLLAEQFTTELVELKKSGARLPLYLDPVQAWQVLAGLQLALRHPGIKDSMTGAALEGIARNIEERLCRQAPAMKEIARRGWLREYDSK